MTPMQKQWAAAKERAKDAILLFRMGDFYELFGEDAEKGAPILELALTSRDKGTKMAGFPHQAAPAYIAKLIAEGLKVAICDQVEDPKKTKGLVKREITRIVTPGTVMEDDSLRPSHNNYLVALVAHPKKKFTLAALDLSTSEFLETSTDSQQSILDEISKLQPSEILIGGEYWPRQFFESLEQVSNQHKACRFELISQTEKHDAVTLIRNYIEETQGGAFEFLSPPKPYSVDSELIIDADSREHLDLHGLFKILNKTCTAMGARQLNRWLMAPSTNLAQIQSRQEKNQKLIAEPAGRKELRDTLKACYDIERLTVKIAASRVTPRELANLRDSLENLPKLVSTLSQISYEIPEDILGDAFDKLAKALTENPPMLLKDGGVFKKGFDPELDEYIEFSSGGRDQIAQIENREREVTGIPSLKVKYTRVFGYYIEVTRTHLDKVPEHYKRKQTIANGERYVTPELSRLEEMVSTADSKRLAKEAQLFEELRNELSVQSPRLFNLSSFIAKLDTFAALAEVAEERRYICPTVLEASDKKLDISNGRHPVLEALHLKRGEAFVPNSVQMDSVSRQILLITGPNMAGKSTIMRQVALIQIMAQMGSYVPAESATLSICDRVFTRVGASDDSRHGRSTFMVEMNETSHILNHSTSHSLVLLDEIGRGTSTFDGLSIAWAVAEHLHEKVGARTMFATHYHELTKLSQSLSKMINVQVSVLEKSGDIKFLYTLQEGAAEKSYGIQVAKLAGLPKTVVDRATQVLESLEEEKPTPNLSEVPEPKKQLSLFADPVHLALKGVDPNDMTPMQALTFLVNLKEQIV